MAVESQPTVEERRTPLSDLLIVDADVHVHESPGALAPYCDGPWDVALRNVADVPERYLDIPGFSPGGDGTLTARFPTSHEAARMVHTPEQMVAELRRSTSTSRCSSPTTCSSCRCCPRPTTPPPSRAPTTPGSSTSGPRATTRCSAPSSPARTTPTDAAREIERYADDPSIVAVYLPCAGLDPLWGHRRYDPIFDAAQNARLPVLLHSVTVTSPVFPFNNHGFDTEFARHATSHTFAIMANIVSMVSTGVVVRFPELKIGVTEAGISWMPFLCQRLDKEYLERRREVPFLTERPSHYVKRIYVATQPIEEPERLRDLVTLVELYDGDDTTIYASDWPHHDFDHPMKLNQVPVQRGAAAQDLRRERARALRDRPHGAPAVTEVVVGRLADFPAGTHKVVQAGGREIGVFNVDGRFYGLPNLCPHQTGPLCEGRAATGTLAADAGSDWKPRWVMRDEVIACPWHGLEYHVPTGQCLAFPEITLRRYPVEVRGDEVVVTVGGRRR